MEVSGGTFYRSYTNDGGGPTGEANPATVSSFRLDKYDVTVGRFRQFINAWDGGAGWLPANGSGKHTHLNGGKGLLDVGIGDLGAVPAASVVYETGWVSATGNGEIEPTNSSPSAQCGSGTWTPSVGSNENLPINCVNWFSAYAFCIWDGGFLPSDAEWEYAAAAGAQEREYPWGSVPPGTDNRYAIYDCDYPDMPGSCTGTATNIAPVGTASLGAGRWGQLDLSGNVEAWVMDWLQVGNPSFVVPCKDCATLSGEDPLWRGSAARTLNSGMPGYRGSFAISLGNGDIGFRCARTP